MACFWLVAARHFEPRMILPIWKTRKLTDLFICTHRTCTLSATMLTLQFPLFLRRKFLKNNLTFIKNMQIMVEYSGMIYCGDTLVKISVYPANNFAFKMATFVRATNQIFIFIQK